MEGTRIFGSSTSSLVRAFYSDATSVGQSFWHKAQDLIVWVSLLDSALTSWLVIAEALEFLYSVPAISAPDIGLPVNASEKIQSKTP